MIGRIGTLVIASWALIGAANAADLAYRKAPILAPEPAVNWTGFYIGGHVGGIWGDSKSFASLGGPQVKVSHDALIAGVQAGYDYQIAGTNWVLGARIAAPIGASSTGSIADPVFAGVRYSSKLNYAVLGTGHVGYAIGQWLPYIGGGVAIGEGRATVSGTFFPGSDTQTHVGYTALAGIRYMVSPKWWVALQYNYTDMGRETYTFPFAVTRNLGYSASSVTGLVSYRF